MSILDKLLGQAESLKNKVNGLEKELPILINVLGEQTLKTLLKGEVIVTDAEVNKYLVMAINDTGEESLKKVEICSLDGNRVQIDLFNKKDMHIRLVSEIIEFCHNEEETYIKIRVLNKKIMNDNLGFKLLNKVLSVDVTYIDNLIAKWVVGNGIEGLNIQIGSEDITVDFRQALVNSKVGKVNLLGQPLINAIYIKELSTSCGFIKIKTELKMQQYVTKSMIKFLSNYAGSEKTLN